MKRKLILVMSMFAMVIALTACEQTGTESSEETVLVESQETTEEEKSVCEQEEHSWVEATCTEPKKCAVCEQTEGETLEHQLTDATYLKGSTCEICKDVIGEPLQPTASEEDIAALQVKLDALVETYNSSNKDAIDIFVEYGEDPDILPQKLNEIYGLSQDFPYWAISFPMIFYKNVNEEPEVPYNFADYTREDSKGSGINDYLHMVQANNDDTKIGGIILWRTMRFVKEIATGNPEVMDIIYGATFQQEECMNVTIKGYGVVKVGDEIYIAKLTEENDIINIYPESHDSIFCPSPVVVKRFCNTTT